MSYSTMMLVRRLVALLALLHGTSGKKRDNSWLAHPVIVGGSEGSGGRRVVTILHSLGVYMVGAPSANRCTRIVVAHRRWKTSLTLNLQ